MNPQPPVLAPLLQPPSPSINPSYLFVALVARPEADRGVAALRASGIARDRIEVIVVEEVPRLEDAVGASGLHRYLVRHRLARGDDLDERERDRRALMSGLAVIQVRADPHDRHRFGDVSGRAPDGVRIS
ncbi:MAG: hypothetical protein WBA46_15695, partial [Thermomicrobiales bacterium]